MKEPATRKEPNPGDAYLRIYLPPDVQSTLEHIAQDNNISRGKLITQIIERYINEPAKPPEKQNGTAGVPKDELNTVLEDIRAAKTWLTQTEQRVKTLLTETEDGSPTESDESETIARDIDVITIRRDPRLDERTKVIIDIIRELERKEGAANIDTIVEQAAQAGFSEDEVKEEITRLLEATEIYEPVPESGNYLTILRIERTRAIGDERRR